MRVLVTGAAGFIGFHVAQRLLAEGHSVVGIDAFTAYYDQKLKRARHDILAQNDRYCGHEIFLEDAVRLGRLVADTSADVVIHLAAQAGVRYSAENPRAYIDSNIIGTFNLLEALKEQSCRHLLLASTSSVYGAANEQPFNEKQSADQPVSLYAATKIATEGLAFNHAHHFQLPITVVRLFTVYGPWGRPDMAFFKFTRSILKGHPIEVYGFGKMRRDFTFVTDVVEALWRLIEIPPSASEAQPSIRGGLNVPYRVVNVGCGQPIQLEQFIETIEIEVGIKAVRLELPMPVGDVPSTWADTTRLQKLTGFKPSTPLAKGMHEFVTWYRGHSRL